MTETRSVNAMISRSLWVMKTIVLFCDFSTLQHREQLIGLGRRQHGGRLVEHEDLGPAHQRLQDLDALLQPDRELADDGVGIDFQRIFFRQPRQFRAHRLRARAQRASRPRRRA